MSREEFQAIIQEAVARFGERGVSERCNVSLPTVDRWARGVSAPHPLGRPSIRLSLGDGGSNG